MNEINNISVYDSPLVLKNVIKLQNEILEYPDIEINFYDIFTDTRIDVIVHRPFGELIKETIHVNTSMLHLNEDYKEMLIDNALRDIGYKYLKQAYEKRKNEKIGKLKDIHWQVERVINELKIKNEVENDD